MPNYEAEELRKSIRWTWEHVRQASELADIGFETFFLNRYRELIAQMTLDFHGVKVVVSHAYNERSTMMWIEGRDDKLLSLDNVERETVNFRELALAALLKKLGAPLELPLEGASDDE
jgi:hypothetical protein